MANSNTSNDLPNRCPECGQYLSHETTTQGVPWAYCEDCGWDTVDGEPDYDDPMDGDHASALASVGWGTDEDYGCYEGADDWF